MAKEIDCYINPLAFHEVDLPWAVMPEEQGLTVDDVLRYLAAPGEDIGLSALVDRYKKISTEKVRLSLPPAEPVLLERLVWPLRHAKASYMVGNYLATIALSGMVAEMAAILLWDMADCVLNQEPLDEEMQKALLGSTFEKLSQDRRVKVLRAIGEIDDTAVEHFTQIRTIRKRYLHLWSESHSNLPDDAVACYQAAVAIVVQAIGQDCDNGNLKLNPKLVEYLDHRGFMSSGERSDGNLTGE